MHSPIGGFVKRSKSRLDMRQGEQIPLDISSAINELSLRLNDIIYLV